ncbi:MAG: mandelate racemase, partial [Hyphomicrobiales bacterium]
IARASALEKPVHAIAAHKPVAIDESDAHIGIFPVARGLGYRGMSSKSCKGFYRAILNAVRARNWNAESGQSDHFMIAEDLTTMPGISVQQDFALAALTGATHVERNGHHYVNGFGEAPLAEQQRYAAAHPDLYTTDPDGRVRLRIENGSVSLASLTVPGLGVATDPDWDSLTRLENNA